MAQMRKVEQQTGMETDSFSKENLQYYCDLLAAKDKRIRQLIADHGYPPFWHREPGFASLVMIILEQQVSLASAFAVFKKLEDRIGGIVSTSILQMSDEDFQFCGFSRQKKTYIKGLAEAVDSKQLNLNQLKTEPIATIRKKLTALKGIGNWTADIYLLSCLHKLDVFPIGDLALVKSMIQAGFIHANDSKEAILKKTTKFKPYRSIFTILLWHRYLRDNNINPPFDL